jgi:hypothetical protein
MSDFYQTGMVATLHRLKANDSERLDRELQEFSEHNKIGLVLPALYLEFETPAMRRIVDELAGVNYLHHIVVALGRAGPKEYEAVKDFFHGFPHPVTILWVDSQSIQDLLALLEYQGLSPGQDGKGRSCWLAYGYLLATGDCDVIALHDCDIAKSLMRTLAGEGLTFTKDQFRSLEVHYVRMAEDTIGRYHADALLNGLEFDRHEEELAVAAFVKSLREAASDFIEDPLGLPLLPNWNRVVAAIPEFFGLLLKGIEGESRMVNSHAA